MKKCEFILYINKNIICQRYFNVRNFNKEVINSIDLYYCINDAVELIESDLKSKSIDYSWKSFNPYKEQLEEEIVKENIFENEDVFDFEIKVDDRVVIAKQFTGNIYQQRVRYSVDVRKIIPEIIAKITETLSQEKLDVEYGSIKLA
jgi:hypothetical protein